jgi:hypothetical protein
VGRVVAGDDQEAAGAFVKPVHDPRSPRVGAAPEDLAELVDERRPPVAGGRVDDQAGRLLDDRQPLVEVDDLH